MTGTKKNVQISEKNGIVHRWVLIVVFLDKLYRIGGH